MTYVLRLRTILNDAGNDENVKVTASDIGGPFKKTVEITFEIRFFSIRRVENAFKKRFISTWWSPCGSKMWIKNAKTSIVDQFGHNSSK